MISCQYFKTTTKEQLPRYIKIKHSDEDDKIPRKKKHRDDYIFLQASPELQRKKSHAATKLEEEMSSNRDGRERRRKHELSFASPRGWLDMAEHLEHRTRAPKIAPPLGAKRAGHWERGPKSGNLSKNQTRSSSSSKMRAPTKSRPWN